MGVEAIVGVGGLGRSALKTLAVLGSRQRSRVPEEDEMLRDACRVERWDRGEENGVQDAGEVTWEEI